MTDHLSPEAVRAFYDHHRTTRHYLTNADGTPLRMPGEHLDAVLYAAQRAPTDATAQLYSFIHLDDQPLRQTVAELTLNAHIASSSEAFVVCADGRRVKKILEANAIAPGSWPAIAVHFGIGDAVMAGQNLLTAAEMLGYQGCWIGGVMNNLDALCDVLKLPEGVLPFAALTVGRSAEDTPLRPRLPRPLVIHRNTYRDGTPEELRAATEIMNPIAHRPGRPGQWARLLKSYFAEGGSMEKREPHLLAVMERQGLKLERTD
ncbi:NADPH-dependent oxidoreductase [Deinococcus cavernae]|uniref:NADPH-dependent oxidoreductase n=1 Tax=Deinococcus cavernae TaxID=2320857 RepID=A0A418V4Q2_9DEIO|nr:nitroreductase family protein [Deinococcus cavernae]RJF71037.1 NADPH-dependent oxidoreductase [Deinococcus cavernae]